MNDKIREVYVRFHTDRRLKLEALTEQRRIQLIEEEGRENSPHAVRDALYWAMEQTTEEDELNVFAELIIKECIDIVHWYEREHYMPDVSGQIKEHFGVE